MKKISTFVATVSLFSMLTVATLARADLQDEGWIFTPVTGLSKPRLDIVHDALFKAPFTGRSEINTDLPEDVAGESAYPSESFSFRNDLQPVEIGWEAGLEMRRNFGLRNDFFIGISVWEISSDADTSVIFPIQGERNVGADYQRRAKFSYTQYYLGMRRYLLDRKHDFNMYVNFSLHEMFDIDYKETDVFTFTSGKPKGFKRVIIYQSQATGLMLMQFGGGGEYRFADRFSISFEGAYALGMRDGTLRDVNVKEDFNAGDRLTNQPSPLAIDATGAVNVITDQGSSRVSIIRLDGWRAVVKFNVAF